MPSMTFQPVSVVNDPQFGSLPWTNPDGFRVKYYGEARADIPINGVTQYAAGAFDLSALPPGITLAGIKPEVQVNSVGVGAYILDASVRIGQFGNPVGDDKAIPAPSVWPFAQRYRVYGGELDLWNAGLDADSLRANGMNLFFAGKWYAGASGDGVGLAKLRGDDMRLTIYWS